MPPYEIGTEVQYGLQTFKGAVLQPNKTEAVESNTTTKLYSKPGNLEMDPVKLKKDCLAAFVIL